MHNYKLQCCLSCLRAASKRWHTEAVTFKKIKCLYFYQSYELSLRQAVLIYKEETKKAKQQNGPLILPPLSCSPDETTCIHCFGICLLISKSHGTCAFLLGINNWLHIWKMRIFLRFICFPLSYHSYIYIYTFSLSSLQTSYINIPIRSIVSIYFFYDYSNAVDSWVM